MMCMRVCVRDCVLCGESLYVPEQERWRKQKKIAVDEIREECESGEQMGKSSLHGIRTKYTQIEGE